MTSLLAITAIVAIAVALRPHKPQSTPFRGIVHDIPGSRSKTSTKAEKGFRGTM